MHSTRYDVIVIVTDVDQKVAPDKDLPRQTAASPRRGTAAAFPTQRHVSEAGGQSARSLRTPFILPRHGRAYTHTHAHTHTRAHICLIHFYKLLAHPTSLEQGLWEALQSTPLAPTLLMQTAIPILHLARESHTST